MLLITGGTGLVGSHLLYKLTTSGENVKALCRKTSNKENVLRIFSHYTRDPKKYFDRIEWVEGDLLDYYSLVDALEGVSKVYHAAALVSFDSSNAYKLIKINTEGTANIVNACLEKKIEKLCHVSSIAAIGSTSNGDPITENVQWDPSVNHSAYSYSKFHSEMEVWRGINEGLQTVIVNPSIIIGPGLEKWREGFSALFTRVWRGMSFYSNGITGYVDVRDVADCMIRLMNSEIVSERFILNAENISFRELLNEIADNLGRKRPFIEAKPWMTQIVWRADWLRSKLLFAKCMITKENADTANEKSIYSNEKIVEVLGFHFLPAKISIEDYSTLFLAEKKSKNSIHS
jgi:dihydroflavonol-4-reductase